MYLIEIPQYEMSLGDVLGYKDRLVNLIGVRPGLNNFQRDLFTVKDLETKEVTYDIAYERLQHIDLADVYLEDV